MDNVVALFDPDAPLRGKAREVAMVSFRAAVEALAGRLIDDAFNACCRLPEGNDLDFKDAITIVLDTCQRELEHVGVSRGGVSRN
jgi:hypothetical protein